MLKFLKILSFVLVLTALFSSGLFFPAKSAKASDMKYEFQVPIGIGNAVSFDGSTKPIGEYIQGIYKYAIGVVAIIATVIMMFGGFLWIMAGGNAEQIGNAKAWIGASLSGLVLVMLSYTILSFINPDLVNFKNKTIKKITSLKEGCCTDENGGLIFRKVTKTECDKKNGKWGGVNSIWSNINKKCIIDSGGCCAKSIGTGMGYDLYCYNSLNESDCRPGYTYWLGRSCSSINCQKMCKDKGEECDSNDECCGPNTDGDCISENFLGTGVGNCN